MQSYQNCKGRVSGKYLGDDKALKNGAKEKRNKKSGKRRRSKAVVGKGHWINHDKLRRHGCFLQHGLVLGFQVALKRAQITGLGNKFPVQVYRLNKVVAEVHHQFHGNVILDGVKQ